MLTSKQISYALSEIQNLQRACIGRGNMTISTNAEWEGFTVEIKDNENVTIYFGEINFDSIADDYLDMVKDIKSIIKTDV